jgi:hypothetical protein
MARPLLWHHPMWQPGSAEIAAEGGADRRSAKDADRPINQSREAHHPARPLHSPEGAMRCTWLGAAAGLGVVKMQLLSREALQFAGQGAIGRTASGPGRCRGGR